MRESSAGTRTPDSKDRLSWVTSGIDRICVRAYSRNDEARTCRRELLLGKDTWRDATR